MALGGEARYLRKQMQEDPGGYGRAFIIAIIVGIGLFVAFLVVGDDDTESAKQAETTTMTTAPTTTSAITTSPTSVPDSGNVNSQYQPSPEEIKEIIEKENQEAYEEYLHQQADEFLHQQAEEYMQMQPEEDGLQDQPY